MSRKLIKILYLPSIWQSGWCQDEFDTEVYEVSPIVSEFWSVCIAGGEDENLVVGNMPKIIWLHCMINENSVHFVGSYYILSARVRCPYSHTDINDTFMGKTNFVNRYDNHRCFCSRIWRI